MAWPLNPQALALLGRSHNVTARVRASVNGSSFILDLPLQPGGSVKIDGSSLTRRTLDCTVVAPIDDPRVDALAAELLVEYVIVAADGTEYVTPVGVFVITDVKEASAGTVKITGADRWQRVIDARFERPTTTSGNTITAMTTLLTDADGRISVSVAAGLAGTHAASVWDRDRGDALKQLAQSIGAVVYFRPDGVARIEPQPTIGMPVVRQIARGTGGTKVSSARGTSRERSYNSVSVKSEPQGAAPLYSVARVTTGKLAYGGPFGKRPRFYATTLVTTQGALDNMAVSLLARVQGVARSLDLTSAPDPTLDYGDVLSVEVAPAVWQRHMVQGMTLPLGRGTTPITTRTDAEDDDGE